MIQTDSGKYAIRALAYIAARDDPSEPISAAEVAQAAWPSTAVAYWLGFWRDCIDEFKDD